jgi:hypothetical protein
MGVKFELRVERGIFLDANIFDPPTACILDENDMVSILKMCKIRNKSLFKKIKTEIWDKLDNRVVQEI